MIRSQSEVLADRVHPEVGPLGKSLAKLGGSTPCGITQLEESLVWSRNMEGRREIIGQTVVRLIPVDKPQRHPDSPANA